jgi:hypothetical protein
MAAYTRLLTVLGVLFLSGCASTFSSTYRAPEATALGFRGQKVVAAVLMKDESNRRLAEDRLSQQIAARGAEGRTLYSLVPGPVGGNEQEVRAALEAANVKGIIVMRPISVDKTVHVKEPYDSQGYASFWGGAGGGGYYGYGFSLSYTSGSSGSVSEKLVVYVETLVYSLPQNKLVWGGVSKSEDPKTLTKLIEQISAATAAELTKEGLITGP